MPLLKALFAVVPKTPPGMMNTEIGMKPREVYPVQGIGSAKFEEALTIDPFCAGGRR
jgi:hypothetical protein